MWCLKQDSPSDTALLIARSVLLAANLPAHAGLLARGEAEAVRGFLGERAERGWFAFAARHGWSRWCLLTVERVLLRGIIAHYLARKRWIEAMVRRALVEHGVRQVVVIGAGFDALGWRLCREDAALRCYELDHPATQGLKKAAAGSAAGVHLLECNLAGESPEEVLARCAGYDAAEPAVVIVEGVTMYLEAERVAALLGSCARVAGRRGRVIFTFMEKADESRPGAADGSLGFRGESSWIGRWLRWRQEPFRWGCTRGELEGFLMAQGLRPRVVADHETLRREILRARGAGTLALARGECVCVCEMSGATVKARPLPFPEVACAGRGRSSQPRNHAKEREIC
jgi:methyltransferase (TIGR00027 family)